MNKLIIIGAGGHGKVVADAATLMGKFTDIAFLDDSFPTKAINSRWPIIGKVKELESFLSPTSEFVIAIGDNQLRLEILSKLKELNVNLTTIIHPTAVISETVDLGEGTVIFANTVINADTQVGQACIINTAATVDHDCILQDGVHLSPRVNLAGNVKIGQASWLGIGSVVKENISIGEKSTVGAGSVVINDVKDNTTVVGVPARELKNNY